MEIKEFLQKTIDESMNLQTQEKFLLSKNSFSAEEIKDAVLFLKSYQSQSFNFKDAIDICGTGGSGLPRINTSTISAFILASLGVKVAKHGNKAASGRFGSFDLLESLGINPDYKNFDNLYKYEDLAFFFAPKFHPIMKKFSEIRKKIGKATFFNILGPLLNPSNLEKQIIGLSSKENMTLLAEICKLLGKKHVFVVYGSDGLDEVTISGETYVTELYRGEIKEYVLNPEDFGTPPANFDEIKGGDPKLNTEIALSILRGDCKSRHLDLVLVNTALALLLAGKMKNLKNAYLLAKKAVLNGYAYDKYTKFKNFANKESILFEIAANKRKEINQRKKTLSLKDLKSQISPNNRIFKIDQSTEIKIIAEIKKSSPSDQNIAKENISVTDIARNYENSGAGMISVLCDEKYFNGNLNDMKKVYDSTHAIPILCKDFIVDKYQIYEARKYFASAVLLIAEILTLKQIKTFIKIAQSLNMQAICEVSDLPSLQKVLDAKAEIIMINNRNLHDFTVDLSTSSRIIKHIPADKFVISASGIFSSEDLDKLPKNINAVLVGTALMKTQNISSKIKELKITKKYIFKACGIRNADEAIYCENLGLDLIGLNFVKTSKRFISCEKAFEICKKTKTIKKVGIFQNQSLDYVNKLANDLKLDYIQLSGNENLSYVKKCLKPVIKTISVKTKRDLDLALKYLPYISFLILDGKKPGSGNLINIDLLKNFKHKFIIAGGINTENVLDILHSTNAIGIDVASALERDGKIDFQKINSIFNKINS